MGYMKNLSNAASSLTAIVNTFDEHVQYKNMSDVHQELLEQVQPKKKTTKGSQTSKMDESDSDEDNEGENEDEDKNYEDDISTNLQQLSGNKTKKGLVIHVDTDLSDDSNSTDNNDKTHECE
jgi:hypothetical protein